MISKSNITFIPEDQKNIDSVLISANSVFEDIFNLNGKFLSSKEPVINLDDKNMLELRNFSKEKKALLVITWTSDDVSEGGITVYDNKKNDSYSLVSNLGSKNIDIISFLIVCGFGEYLSKVLF